MARSISVRPGLRVVGVCGLLAALAGGVEADQILKVYPAPLTSYLPTSASASQAASPIHLQRGVGVDGSMRAPGAFRWAMAASPVNESWNSTARLGPMNLAAGTYAPTEVDLALPATVPWVVGRSFNGRQVLSSAHHDSNGPQGYNWSQLSQPELVRFEGASDDLDVVYLVYGADRWASWSARTCRCPTACGTSTPRAATTPTWTCSTG